MAGNITRNIGTTFTLTGTQAASAHLRAFGTSVRVMAAGFRDRFQSMREAAQRAFAPILAGLKKIAQFSFKALEKSAVLAFKGMATYAVLATLKIKGIAAAATEVTKRTSEMLGRLGFEAQNLGLSINDDLALRHGFDAQGLEADKIIGALSGIATGFRSVRESIDLADRAYFKTSSWNDRRILHYRNIGSISDAVTSNFDAAQGSLAGISDQKELIENRIRMTSPSQHEFRFQMVELWRQLDAKEIELKRSFGDQGQALQALEQYGLDFKRALEGGNEGFDEISNAFRGVTDAQEQLRISSKLFGAELGARMILILQGGVEALQNYRQDLEKLGGVVTPKDIKDNDELVFSVQRLKTAFSGLQLEISRGMRPLLTQTNKQITEWIVANRKWVADLAVNAFGSVKAAYLDIYNLFHGQRSDFKNSWINAAAPALLFIYDWTVKIKDQLTKIFSGRDSDWKWLNIARDGLVNIYKLVKDVWAVAFGGKAETFAWVDTLAEKVKWLYDQVIRLPEEIGKLWSGKDSDWKWLNTVGDGLLYLRDLATDVWEVLTGGKATRFDFLNTWRDTIVAFAAKVGTALDFVVWAFEKVHSAAQAVFGFFGKDATTIALIGIFGRLALSITGVGAGLKLIWPLFKKLGTMAVTALGLGAAAASSGAAAGAVGAAAGAATGAGAAAATGGLVAGLTRVGTVVTALISRFGLLGTVITGVMVGGKMALDYSERSSDKVIEKQLQLMRMQADQQLDARHQNRLNNDGDYRAEYWNKQLGIDTFVGPTAAGATRRMLDDVALMSRPSAEQANDRAAIMSSYQQGRQAQAERTVNLNIAVGNQTLPAMIKESDVGIVGSIYKTLRNGL